MDNDETIFKEVKNFFLELKEITDKIKTHYRHLQVDNIINSQEYYVKMENIKKMRKDMFENIKVFDLIKHTISEVKIDIFKSKFKEIKDILLDKKNELKELIREDGYTSILEILKIFLKNKNEMEEISKKLGIINNFFVVTRFKEYIYNEDEKNEDKKEYEDKKVDDNNCVMLSDCTELMLYDSKNILKKIVENLNKKKREVNIEISNECYKKEEDYEKFNEFIETPNGEVNIRSNKINLIYELNKASIKIEINNDLYLINGYFKEDIFNEMYLNEDFEGKYFKIINYYDSKVPKPINYNKYCVFVEEFMNQYSPKDFIIKSIDDIMKEIKTEYEKNIYLSKKTIQELVDLIIDSDIYNKRLLIIHGLISENCKKNDQNKLNIKEDYEMENEIRLNLNIKYDKNKNIKYKDFSKKNESKTDNKSNNKENKDKYDFMNEKKTREELLMSKLSKVKMNKKTAERYAINSLIKNTENNSVEIVVYNSNKTINSNILLEFLKNKMLKTIDFIILKKSIHYNLRKKIFIKELELGNEKNKDEMSWEMKLDSLDLSDTEKNKVLEKIKEFKTGKDNSKAENYIDTFFKIPIGKYICEDIFERCKESNKKIENYLEKLNNELNNVSKNEKINRDDPINDLVIKQKVIKSAYAPELLGHLIKERDVIKKIRKNYLNYVDNVLESAIYGHKDSKRQIKREVGKWLNSGETNGIVLGFHGPPGVGKTTLGKKGISKCLVDNEGNNRPFVMIQLGGHNDGSTFTGHNYTYIGSKPGDLIDALIKAKCMNPIIFFDELDKVSEDVKGREIINILIHLTDKSQNNEMHDKFFSGINFDFSKCIIIFSYNDRTKINKTLRDRITEIEVEPLKVHEKIEVINRFTLVELEERLNYKCKINNEIIRYIIENYTFEAGVRKLNERIEELFSELNLKDLEGEYINKNEINENLIDNILDRHVKILRNKIHTIPKKGYVNGLYATTIGIGGITLIQIDIIKITEKKDLEIKVTGKLGEVMKESVECSKTVALNLLSNEENNKLKTGLKENPFSLHMHCPDAATPKDGPSAGITITLAIYSYLSNKKVRNDVAMTGEIDLYGKVKAIGGLSEKMNGAIKAGVKKVIIPKENEEDYKKIIRKNLLDGNIECVLVESIYDVINHAIIK